MDHFAGLDVSVEETSVCIVDDTGRIVREVKVASEPEALLRELAKSAYRFKRIGLEAGPLSQWLFSGLGEAGLPVICVETRHMRAVLKGADQQDRPQRCARDGADDAGWTYVLAHVEDVAQSETAHAADPPQAAAVEGYRYRQRPARHLAQLWPQGGYGQDGKVRSPHQGVGREPTRPWRFWSNRCSLSGGRFASRSVILHRRLLAIVRDDEVCRRLMTTCSGGQSESA